MLEKMLVLCLAKLQNGVSEQMKKDEKNVILVYGLL